MECKRQGALNCSIAQGTIGGCFTLPNSPSCCPGVLLPFSAMQQQKGLLVCRQWALLLLFCSLYQSLPYRDCCDPSFAPELPPCTFPPQWPLYTWSGLLRSKPHGAQWDPHSQIRICKGPLSGDLFLPSVGFVSPIEFNGRSSPYKTPSSHPGHHRLASQLWPFIPTRAWSNREAGRRNQRTYID